jgi:hypothetical protein
VIRHQSESALFFVRQLGGKHARCLTIELSGAHAAV